MPNNMDTVKILDYWFALEFLSQDKYPDYFEKLNHVKKYKNDLKNGKAKNRSIEVFIPLNADNIGDNLYEIVSNEAISCGMKKWGSLTFYIGKIMREV